MFMIRKLFRFEAAHQLSSAETEACTASIHGHSYVVELFLQSRCMDGNGMVMDFSSLRTFIDVVKAEWDHALILPPKLAPDYTKIPSEKVVLFPTNPTAEAMAKVLFDGLKQYLNEKVMDKPTNKLAVHKVRVHETVTGWAEYSEPTTCPESKDPAQCKTPGCILNIGHDGHPHMDGDMKEF